MTHINRTALVALPAEKLFDLILDVESYPAFLPWCSAAVEVERSDSHQLATVTIAKGPLKTSFTTRNTLTAPDSIPVTAVNGDIRMRLVDGPFRHLDGNWRFHVLSADACKVEMDMNFDFAMGPTGLLLKPVFTHICTTLLNAFVHRSKELYGTT